MKKTKENGNCKFKFSDDFEDCEEFGKFAKVFSVKFLPELDFAIIKIAFFILAKISAAEKFCPQSNILDIKVIQICAIQRDSKYGGWVAQKLKGT